MGNGQWAPLLQCCGFYCCYGCDHRCAFAMCMSLPSLPVHCACFQGLMEPPMFAQTMLEQDAPPTN